MVYKQHYFGDFYNLLFDSNFYEMRTYSVLSMLEFFIIIARWFFHLSMMVLSCLGKQPRYQETDVKNIRGFKSCYEDDKSSADILLQLGEPATAMQVKIGANKEKWYQPCAQKQIKHGFLNTTVFDSLINHQFHEKSASADENKKMTFSEETRFQYAKRDVVTSNETEKTTLALNKIGKLVNLSSKFYKCETMNTKKNVESR